MLSILIFLLVYFLFGFPSVFLAGLLLSFFAFMVLSPSAGPLF
jgi:hypothetical protein